METVGNQSRASHASYVWLVDLRKGVVSCVHVTVVEVWEGGAFIAGDRSGSLKFVVPASFPIPIVGDNLHVEVELQKSHVWVRRVFPNGNSSEVRHECGKAAKKEDDSVPPAHGTATTATTTAANSPSILESCGVIIMCRLTHRFLLVRDYHSRAFMDVQFKLKAAFDGRLRALDVDSLLLHIDAWTDEEVRWVVGWNLKGIWPFVTEQRLQQWNAVMRSMDAQIKVLYRAAKAEHARRRAILGEEERRGQSSRRDSKEGSACEHEEKRRKMTDDGAAKEDLEKEGALPGSALALALEHRGEGQNERKGMGKKRKIVEDELEEGKKDVEQDGNGQSERVQKLGVPTSHAPTHAPASQSHPAPCDSDSSPFVPSSASPHFSLPHAEPRALIANSSWSFPKGGLKIVGGRVEAPEEAAIRELHEEVGLEHVTVSQLARRGDIGLSGAPHGIDWRTQDAKQQPVQHHPCQSLSARPALLSYDVPRAHGRTLDRWFVLYTTREQPIAPPAKAWDVAALAWVTREQILQTADLARFGACLEDVERAGASMV